MKPAWASEPSLSLPSRFTILLFYDLKELVPEAASSFVKQTKYLLYSHGYGKDFMRKTI